MPDAFVTPQTLACQAPLFIDFSRQEYWNGLSFPTPGDLPEPGIKLTSPALAGGFFTTEPPGKPIINCVYYNVRHSLYSVGNLTQKLMGNIG